MKVECEDLESYIIIFVAYMLVINKFCEVMQVYLGRENWRYIFRIIYYGNFPLFVYFVI